MGTKPLRLLPRIQFVLFNDSKALLYITTPTQITETGEVKVVPMYSLQAYKLKGTLHSIRCVVGKIFAHFSVYHIFLNGIVICCTEDFQLNEACLLIVDLSVSANGDMFRNAFLCQQIPE